MTLWPGTSYIYMYIAIAFALHYNPISRMLIYLHNCNSSRDTTLGNPHLATFFFMLLKSIHLMVKIKHLCMIHMLNTLYAWKGINITSKLYIMFWYYFAQHHDIVTVFILLNLQYASFNVKVIPLQLIWHNNKHIVKFL